MIDGNGLFNSLYSIVDYRFENILTMRKKIT